MNTVAVIGQKTPQSTRKLARQWIAENKPGRILTGLDLGWCQDVALAAQEAGIPVLAYIGHHGQADTWPKASCELYSRILGACAEVKLLDLGGYSPEKMQRRNEAMVNDCDLLLALWDGSAGGTKNCLNYAEIEGCPVTNVWGKYIAANQPEEEFEV